MSRRSRQQQHLQQLHAAGDEFAAAFASGEDDDDDDAAEEEKQSEAAADDQEVSQDVAAQAGNIQQRAARRHPRAFSRYIGRKSQRKRLIIVCLSIVYFMRYRDNVEYDFGHYFTTEQLAAVTPDEDDIIRYFKFKCYGNPEADTDV